MTFDPREIEKFPVQPGVYLMKSLKGAVLYVGKAKNIRKRLKTYFGGGDDRPTVPYLTAQVDNIDTIIVSSEKEALLLENTLIKKHQPKYNILLKDDKSYASLTINISHEWPTIQLVRYNKKDNKTKDSNLYFGPYTSTLAARQTLEIISRLFPLRQCSDRELATRGRPCLMYQMGRCVGPCAGKITKEEYDMHVQKAIRFLRGQDKETVQELYAQMERLSTALEFEKAASALRTIRQIENTLETQRVDTIGGSDSDVLGLYREGDAGVLIQLQFREGKLIGSTPTLFNHLFQTDEELIESFLLQHYKELKTLPREIILPMILEEASTLEQLLSEDRKHKTHLHTPQRGDKRALVEMARENAQADFRKAKDDDALREKTLLSLQETFLLTRYPARIECFDHSHIAGTDAVASMVVYTNGKQDRKEYRKYKIKSAKASDDYGALTEVLGRRFSRAKTENNFPDLLIIDGGKGHLGCALKVLDELNISCVDVIAVAKEEGRHDKGSSAEQVFLPGSPEALLLGTHSPLLFFLQQVRDEAHRVAISFHRHRRSKGTLKSGLDTIPGIGPVKRTALLRHFGSLKRILAASEEQLLQVPGITRKDAHTLTHYRA